MATFEVGKTYYFNYYNIEKFEVVKKTKCYILLINRQRGEVFQKKIRYTKYGNEYGNEEYIIFRKKGMIRERHLYSSCKWSKYWKIGKDEEGNETIIKPDITTFYKMNTATLKMYKYICNEWKIEEYCFMPIEFVEEYMNFEEKIKRQVEENTEDFDKDYYSLYYTANINWHMINTKYKQNYILKHKKYLP